MSKNSMMKRALLASVSAAGISLAAGAAQAQDTPPPPATEEVSDSDIVVTGIRGSLQLAQDLKRFAPAVIESITSEDLGKFSDLNIADALQRVPGVQIERNDGGFAGDRIVIRGLGSQYTQVTVNQRTLVSYGDLGGTGRAANLRNFNLDAVPTEVISGITLYKTPIAQNVEPGLAGLVNLQTLRPLDYQDPRDKNAKFFGTAAVRGEIDSLGKELRPRYSGAFGAKLFDNTLGIFVSGLIADTRTSNNELRVSPSTRTGVRVSDGNGGSTVLAPFVGINNINIDVIQFRQQRRSGTAAVQWKPDPRLEINLNFTYNKFNNNTRRPDNTFDFSGIYSGVRAPGELTIENGALTGVNSTNQIGIGLQDSYTFSESTTKYGGANVAWKGDGWKIAGDYGHSDVDYFSSYQVVYGINTAPSAAVSFQTVNGLPQFTIGDAARNNAGQIPYAFYNSSTVLKTGRDAFRLDGEIELSSSFKVRAGARYEKTTVDSRGGEAYAFTPQGLIFYGFGDPTRTDNFGSVPLDREQRFTPAEIAASTAAFAPAGRTYSSFSNLGIGKLGGVSIDGYCSVAVQLCNLGVRGGSLYSGAFPTATENDGTNDINLAAGNSYYAREQNIALYAQVEGRGDVFGIPVDGNLGLRAVNIELKSQAFTLVQPVTRFGASPVNVGTGVRAPTRDKNQYWQFLPNLNLTFHPSEQFNVRFGVARTISLPQYEDTAPRGTVFVFDRTAANYLPPSRGGLDEDYGTYGNTRLKPVSSWNYDLTLEYYTPWKGAVIASLFDKDVSNTILVTETNGVTIPGQSALFRIAGPLNVSKAYARGIEIGFNQPFLFLPSPFDGLGLQANYTYIDSRIKSTLVEAQYGLPGAARHNANLVAYYEKYGFGIRVGYTYRSKNLLGLSYNNSGSSFSVIEEPIENLDVNVTYDITKNFQLTASAANITQARRREYLGNPEALSRFYNRPVFYSFGVRGSF